MKVLGFILDSRASMLTHVNHVKKKVGARLWTLIHMKRVGIGQKTLVGIYCALIRTVVEYGCQVYACQLTATQSDIIESIQRRAFKIIYGPGVSYTEALTTSSQERLSERRPKICEKLVKKTEENDCYRH